MATEKVKTQAIQHVQSKYSAEKKTSINKIVIRGGGYSKELSPEKQNYFHHHLEKVWVSEKNAEPEGPLLFEGPKKSLDKKFTAFER
jgi:dual specificity tyrosine-phosphorylation-regulated kinase 2/3/4